MKGLTIELQTIKAPIAVAELFSDIAQFMPELEKLYICTYHINDPTLDAEAVQTLQKPIFPNLEELIFSIYDTRNMPRYETLFQPVLQHLFHGTQVELVDFGYYDHPDEGYQFAWGSQHLDDILFGPPRPFATIYPSWSRGDPGRLANLAMLRNPQEILLKCRESFDLDWRDGIIGVILLGLIVYVYVFVLLSTIGLGVHTMSSFFSSFSF